MYFFLKKTPHQKIKLLLLGGTEDTASFIRQFDPEKFLIIPSYAGRTKKLIALPHSRIGGFGGAQGLATYLRDHKIDGLLDSTHPFATKITQTAYQVAQNLKLPYWRFDRPAWKKQIGDLWSEFTSLEEIAKTIPSKARCFLALGRQHIEVFSQRSDVYFIARMIESTPLIEKFSQIKVFLSHPLNFEEEYSFIKSQNISLIICRNSGGQGAYAKIEAARTLKCPVFLLKRPQNPMKTYSDAILLKQVIYRHFLL